MRFHSFLWIPIEWQYFENCFDSVSVMSVFQHGYGGHACKADTLLCAFSFCINQVLL